MNLEFIRGDENALAVERIISEITLTKWRNSNSELQNYFNLEEQFLDQNQKDTVFDKFKIKIKVFMWRHWWSYPDELRLLKGVLAQPTHNLVAYKLGHNPAANIYF